MTSHKNVSVDCSNLHVDLLQDWDWGGGFFVGGIVIRKAETSGRSPLLIFLAGGNQGKAHNTL